MDYFVNTIINEIAKKLAYDVQLWDRVSISNIEILEKFQYKVVCFGLTKSSEES